MVRGLASSHTINRSELWRSNLCSSKGRKYQSRSMNIAERHCPRQGVVGLRARWHPHVDSGQHLSRLLAHPGTYGDSYPNADVSPVRRDQGCTKLWQGLLTLPLGRPKVSNPRETYGPEDGGVWRPAPNRQFEIRKLFPARSFLALFAAINAAGAIDNLVTIDHY